MPTEQNECTTASRANIQEIPGSATFRSLEAIGDREAYHLRSVLERTMADYVSPFSGGHTPYAPDSESVPTEEISQPKKAVICEICGMAVYEGDARDDIIGINESICSRCVVNYVVRCGVCGREAYHQAARPMWDDAGGRIICIECILKDNIPQHFLCNRCGNWVVDEDRIGGTTICPRCNKTIVLRDMCREYDYRAEPNWRRTKESRHDKLFIGVELETEVPREDDWNMDACKETLGSINRRSEIVYCVRDGSLEHGIEFVTHPGTIDWWKSSGRKVIDTLFSLSEYGYQADNTKTCGMHVHMSLRAFTTFHLYKFIRLFTNWPDFTYEVSNRDDRRRFRRWCNPYLEDNGECPKDMAKCKNNEEKHLAVNLRDGYTVEVRVFKGTLNPNVFMDNLELCYAAYEFTRDTGLSEITPVNFKCWMQKKPEYLVLYESISKRLVRREELCVG